MPLARRVRRLKALSEVTGWADVPAEETESPGFRTETLQPVPRNMKDAGSTQHPPTALL